MNIDPSGKDAGWLRQAGEYLKEGGEQIKASPDLPEWYFKTFNAFGSVLGFAAPALVVSPLGGLPSLALAGTMGVGAGADEAYERAEQAGATEEQIDSATYLGGGVGLSEIAAPIKAGTTLGTIKIKISGKPDISVPLIAENDVDKLNPIIKIFAAIQPQ